MTLPRKDVKFTLTAALHQALLLVAEQEGKAIHELTEHVVSHWLMRKARGAILLADSFRRTGIEETFRESAFTNGKGDE